MPVNQRRTCRSLSVAAVGTALIGTLAPSAAAVEKPTSAEIQQAKVTSEGHVRVKARLRCPAGTTWTASMTIMSVSPDAPEDIRSSTSWENPPTGRCSGRPERVTMLLITVPIQGTFYPAPTNCSPEYGVTFRSETWSISFDRGGADGGPDGPGDELCLR